mmetsp:Transcript_38580/g.95418  ORF Transcript_38580/g.95418 Transcript_38580/m.95418 type:complete len:308 (-) Transcript_38580:121-1044(-)
MPVGGVLLVPVDRRFEAVHPVLLLLPAELDQLGGVHVISLVVEHAVLHVLDAILRHVEMLRDCLHDVQHCAVDVGADVVSLADHALVHDYVEGGGDVLHVQVGAPLLPVSVYPQGHAAQRKVNHFRHEFLRVLTWSVDIVAARHDDGQFVRVPIARAQHLGGCLGGCVRVGGLHLGHLVEDLVALSRVLAVHLVGAHVHEPLHARHCALCRLKQHVRAEHVVGGEDDRVAERVVHVRLRGEVEDRVNLLRLEQVVEQVGLLDVALDELEVAQRLEVLQVLAARAVVELVEDDDFVGRVLLDHAQHER